MNASNGKTVTFGGSLPSLLLVSRSYEPSNVDFRPNFEFYPSPPFKVADRLIGARAGERSHGPWLRALPPKPRGWFLGIIRQLSLPLATNLQAIARRYSC